MGDTTRMILAKAIPEDSQDEILKRLVVKGLTKLPASALSGFAESNMPNMQNQYVPPLGGTLPIVIDKSISNLQSDESQPQNISKLPEAIPTAEKFGGLKDFARSFGYGATGTPIDLESRKIAGGTTPVQSEWLSRLGGTIGQQFGNASLERALYGTTGKRNILPQTEFYNTPQDRNKAAAELEKAIKLKEIESEMEKKKLANALEAMGSQFRPKSITSSGDITYEHIPTEEEIQADLTRKAREEAIKPPTAEQGKANTYVNRMMSADKVLSDIDKRGGFGPLEILSQAKSPNVLGMQASTPNILKTPEMQKFDQAKRNFINAVLRRESGAAISPSEFANADLQYFRQPGDSKEVLAQKAENRRLVIEGMKKEAGRGFEDITTKPSNKDNDPLGIR